MANNPVVWFEIYVQDMPKAKAFYEAVLNVTLTKLESPVPDLEMWQFPSDMTATGASGALAKMQGVKPGGISTVVYFACEDCAVEAARVVPAGGRIKDPKMSIGQYGFIALAYDRDGNMFGLHSMK
jgi:predicted enzyme related to lactoylglutathione lyase